MRNHAKRRQTARMIRAAAHQLDVIRCDASMVEWVQAAGDAEPGPKKFSMTAYTGGPMSVANYGVPVVIDLAGLKAEAPCPILLDHNSERIVGHADAIDVGQSTLKLSGIMSGAGPAAAEVIASAKNGFPWKASVGARPDKLEFVGENIATTVNGKSFKGPLYVARKATLGEVSFVAVAADGRTHARVAATAAQLPKELRDMNYETWVEAMGLTLADLRDDQKAKLQTKYDAEVKAAQAKDPKAIEAGAAKVEPPKFDLAGVILTYEKHIANVEAKAATYAGKVADPKLAEIRAAASQAAAELKVKALNEEWATPRFEVELVKASANAELAMVRAERPAGPGIHSSSHDASPAVIEASLCQSAGLSNLERHFKPEVIEAAQHKDRRNIGLQELLLIHAHANGYTGRASVNQGNLREVIRAAFSTNSITTLLSTTGNKLLLDGFDSLPQSWREVAEVRSVNDFKTVTAFRMTATLEYEEVGPGGEIKHGTVGQESYDVTAKTYAKMLVLTRQDIINDDLGAFNAIRTRLGVGAAIKVNKVFWTAWLTASNAGTFWTGARTNLVTSSALAEAGLNTAVAAFRDMAGPDGNMMSLEPVMLLVPSALEATARKFYTSQEVRDTTASTKFAVANIYQNRFRPVIVPELGNSAYTGYSATTWFLLADPRVLASAQMAFLGGQQSPVIESTDADFDTLGIQFRGYHDFGVGMTEYRASVKATA